MKDAPKVSVITPFYNSEKFLEETIQSVINQTFSHWELLLVNDSSTDNSRNIAEKYCAADSRIQLINLKKNSGAGIARNNGTQNAKGKYIAFLDADDVWLPHKLETQLEFMEKHQVNLCFSSYLLMDEQGNQMGKMIEALQELSYQKLLKSNYIGNLTGIYNAEVLGKIYSPEIRKRQDWALWLKILKSEKVALGIKESLAIYRLRNDSISQNKLALLKYNFAVYNEVLGYNKPKSCLKMLGFLWEHFFVKSKQLKSVVQ
jgi:teichuronic acid biosynthesis glycosyltransferase TuaG